MQPAKSDFAAESANVSAAVLAATAAADDSESAAPAPGPEVSGLLLRASSVALALINTSVQRS